jgi:hypothetical protein
MKQTNQIISIVCHLFVAKEFLIGLFFLVQCRSSCDLHLGRVVPYVVAGGSLGSHHTGWPDPDFLMPIAATLFIKKDTMAAVACGFVEFQKSPQQK